MNYAVSNYLHTCRNAFDELAEKKFQIKVDFDAMEASVAHLRGHKPLTHSDLRSFENPERWWFKKFWAFPSDRDLTPALQQTTFNFWQLPKNERNVIESLLGVFKSIELVSIILRFIRPEHYGIISPPVENVLHVLRGSNGVETYLNYLANLRIIQKQYCFKRAADADMALWVLHEKCFGDLRVSEIERDHTADTFFRQLRARNLVVPFEGYSYPELAGALEAVKPDLAALIAAYTLELQIRKIAEMYRCLPEHTEDDSDKIYRFIEALYKAGKISSIRKGNWRRFMIARNKLFHEGKQPLAATRNDLINEIRQIEIDFPGLRLG
jgi:hypothetical protein